MAHFSTTQECQVYWFLIKNKVFVGLRSYNKLKGHFSNMRCGQSFTNKERVHIADQSSWHYAHCTMRYAHCTTHYAPCTLYYAHFTMHISLCTLHYTFCTMHTVLRRLYPAHNFIRNLSKLNLINVLTLNFRNIMNIYCKSIGTGNRL